MTGGWRRLVQITFGTVIAIGSIAGCSAHDSHVSLRPSPSTPAPNPVTSPPPINTAYQAATYEFCATADAVYASLRILAQSGPVENTAEAFASVGQTYHNAFSKLLAAHSAQFGDTKHLNVEPLDSAFSADALIALKEQQAAGTTGFLSLADDAVTTFTAVGQGCASQGNATPNIPA